MYKGSQSTSIDLVTRLTTEANNCDFKAKQSLDNRRQVEKLQKSLDEERMSKDIATNAITEIKGLLAMLNEYLNEKKTKGLASVYAAIYSARSIIPDTSNIELVVEKERAYLANQAGLNVNKVEGSAFRALLSLFVRDRLLKSTNFIQTMLLDEPLSTLDPESSAEVSKYLPILASESPMVLIEQKDAIFEAIEHTCYSFRKSEGYTTVRRDKFSEGGSDGDDKT